MKVIVCGKGGSGKSTITALLAKQLSRAGYSVLVIDADESNLGLHRLLGIPSPVVLMDHLGGKKGFREKSKPAFPGGAPDLFPPQMTMDHIPAGCISEHDSIRLLSVGKIHTVGEGCACPMGVLSKMILSRLIIDDKTIVLIDTTAGVEHFGRGIDTHCDLLLSIVDPTRESILLAEKMSAIAGDANLDIAFILNKMDARILPLVEQELPDTSSPIATIPNSDVLFMAGLEGTPVNPDSIDELTPVVRFLADRKAGA